MEINNLVEVCAPITVAIISLAYPIILDKTSDIGDKYKSEYISQVFETEILNNKLKYCGNEVTYFQICLYLALFSQIFLIFSFEPLFGWNNWMINNSSYLLVFLATSVLIILFFIWLNNVVLYSGKLKSLLKHLIMKYNKSKTPENQQILLKAINDIAIYSIDKQDHRIEEDLLKFYIEKCLQFRNEYDKNK